MHEIEKSNEKIRKINHLVSPLNEHQAAGDLGVSVFTLRNWRHLSRGPAYLKIGRRVLYDPADLQAYKDRQRINPEA